jgi:1-acyl-sn-glycerol-3-phosphate acyltransferase
MGLLSNTLRDLRERVDDAFTGRIDPELWDRIRNMDAGQNEYGFDPFGFQPEFLKYVGGPASFIFNDYFRTDVFDIENIPNDGAVMLISNHSGQVAIDGFLIGCACLFRKDPPRMVRSMVEHWVPTLPFVSTLFSRAGQVVGTRENARILLGRGGCLSAFPEGVGGIAKTYDQAYQLQRFGNGFMRLALETNTPIVPIGVVGGEEQIPSVWNVEALANLFGAPAFPVTPAMLLLGPAGALPLPVKYRIYFGEPMQFEGKSDDEDKVIASKVDQVKAEIERLIERGLDEREGVFF